jgi:competence protein ComEA
MVLIKNKSKTGIILVLFLCISIILCSCSKKSYLDKKAEANELRAKSDTLDKISNDKSETDNIEKKVVKGTKYDSNETWYVEVSGAVNAPGVYRIRPGARVFEALNKAGGITADACIDDINQAAPVKDGQKITLQSKSQMLEDEKSGGSGQNSKTSELISLNKATKEELMTLPGVGESKASDIIKYREEHGGFATTEELMEISGIKEGVYNKLSDKITVD